MKFAWVRFDATKEEFCKKLSDIKIKSKEKDLVVAKSIDFVDEQDIKQNYYFCQRDNEKKWSKVIILHVGETEKEVINKANSQRKKYKSIKCFQTDSSFEESKSTVVKMVKKELASRKNIASQERAKAVLGKVKNSVELPKYIDSDSEKETETNTGKNDELKTVSVSLVRLVDDQHIKNAKTINIESQSSLRSTFKETSQTRPSQSLSQENILHGAHSTIRSASQSPLRKMSRSNHSSLGSKLPLREISLNKHTSEGSPTLSPSTLGENNNTSISDSRTLLFKKSQEKTRNVQRTMSLSLIDKTTSFASCTGSTGRRYLSESSLRQQSCDNHKFQESQTRPPTDNRLQQRTPSVGRSPRQPPLDRDRTPIRETPPPRSRTVSTYLPKSPLRQRSGDNLRLQGSRTPTDNRHRYRTPSGGRSSRQSPVDRDRTPIHQRPPSRSPTSSSSSTYQGSQSRTPTDNRHRHRTPVGRSPRQLPLNRDWTPVHEIPSNRFPRDSRYPVHPPLGELLYDNRSYQRSESRSPRDDTRRYRTPKGRSPQHLHLHEDSQRRRTNQASLSLVNADEENNGNARHAERGQKRRQTTVKKPQFILDCVEYYENCNHGKVEMQNRYKTDNGNVYLGEGISISCRQWSFLQVHKPTIFLCELSIILWTEESLCNRAFDLTRPVENIPGRSPVKMIEHNLLRLTISLYNDYLKRNSYSSNERVKYLLDVVYVIRHKIRDLRALEKKKARNNESVSRRVLRYNVSK